jgi:MFS superfamily sulfate permease-like transporter
MGGLFAFIGYIIFDFTGIIIGVIIGIAIAGQVTKNKDSKDEKLNQIQKQKQNQSYRHMDNTRKKSNTNLKQTNRSTQYKKTTQKKKSSTSKSKTTQKKQYKNLTRKDLKSTNTNLSLDDLVEDTSEDIEEIADTAQEEHEKFFKRISKSINKGITEMKEDFQKDYEHIVEEKTDTFQQWLTKREENNRKELEQKRKEKIEVQQQQKKDTEDIKGLYEGVKTLEEKLEKHTQIETGHQQKQLTEGKDKPTDETEKQVNLFQIDKQAETKGYTTYESIETDIDYYASDTLKRALGKSGEQQAVSSDTLNTEREITFNSDILSMLEKMAGPGYVRSDTVHSDSVEKFSLTK